MSEEITAILVDDEESARDVLSNLLGNFCPQIKVLDRFTNVEAAVEGIKKLKPQVAFLDIEMPNYAGYEIVKFFQQIDFEIIFVTAYDSYAVKAFEVSAVDYLLKPVDIDRLKKTVSKLEQKIGSKAKCKNYDVLTENLRNPAIEKISVPDNGCRRIMNVKDIIAIEAQESYSYFHTTTGSTLVSKNLKHYEEVLSENKKFFRTHKSWIVNIDFMSKYSKTKAEVTLENDVVAKLSKYRKADFEALIK